MKPSVQPASRSVRLLPAPPSVAGLGTALPALRVSQREVYDFVRKHFGVGPVAEEFYRRTLAHPGIETRHFALEKLEDCLEPDPDVVARRFERSATELAAQALEKALSACGAVPEAIDFLAVSTCTGYACPGVSAHVLERAGLRADARLADLVGMGCGAAIPALEAASNFLAANPDATAAAVSVEICSAAIFSNEEPGIIVSNALFADGAAAAILRARPPERNGVAHPKILGFAARTIPEWRDTLRFRTEKGRLKNILGKDVPAQAAEAVESVADALLDGRARADVARWILHAGGPKVLDAIESRLALDPPALGRARDVLRRCGNMSSPTVLFVLAEECRLAKPNELGVMASFGAGFTAHGALLSF
jgi:alkylresorcinol/alkylpyrone synthase